MYPIHSLVENIHFVLSLSLVFIQGLLISNDTSRFSGSTPVTYRPSQSRPIPSFAYTGCEGEGEGEGEG